jgi:hypothetical protein
MPDDNGDVDNCAGLRGELNIVRDKANPRRRNRAVSLIEAVLYISIALALIVGGLVFFQQASTAAKTSTMVRQLSAMLAEARVLAKGLPVGATPLSITPLLISAGAVPPDMLESAFTLSNPFGGSVQIYSTLTGGDPALYIFLSNVPQSVCARLLTATSGSGSVSSGYSGSSGPSGMTLVSSGYVEGRVSKAGTDFTKFKNYIMNPTQAGWMCKYGSTDYASQTAEPTSTPLSGYVAMDMIFLVDA